MARCILYTPPPHAYWTRCRRWVSEWTRSSVGSCKNWWSRDGLIHSLASKLNSLAYDKYRPCQGWQIRSMQLPQPSRVMLFTMYKVDVVKFYESSFFIAKKWIQNMLSMLRIECWSATSQPLTSAPLSKNIFLCHCICDWDQESWSVKIVLDSLIVSFWSS